MIEVVTTIVGSDREARISERVEVLLPRKTVEPDDYAELEQRLRATDAWPAVSALDVHALRRIWKGDADDPGGVRKQIQEFVREKRTKRISFRRRKPANTGTAA